MAPELINIITEAGPIGVFLIYMLHQNRAQSQKKEAQQKEFLRRLDDMDQRSDAALATLRDRYDKVLQDYATERAQLIAGFGKLDQLIMRMGMTPVQPQVSAPPAPPPEPPAPGMTMQIEQKVRDALVKAMTEGGEDEG
jgi:hypothetical protein